jgi:hypothetical protein
MKDYKRIFESIKQTKGTYSLGEAWRSSEHATAWVVPILNPKLQKRDYVTATEAIETLDIIDDGQISPLQVVNKGLKPIYMRAAEIMKGDTQSRALVHSRVIMPGKQSLEVVCVHASHGIRSGSRFHSAGYAPGRDILFQTKMVDDGHVDQVHSWDHDEKMYKHYMNSTFSTGKKNTSMRNTMAEIALDDTTKVKEKVDEVLKPEIEKIPVFEDQIGYAVVDAKGIVSMDWYDSRTSFDAQKKELYLKDGLLYATIDPKSKKKQKVDPLMAFADSMPASMERKVIFEDVHCTVTALQGGDYVGEITQLLGHVIHFSLSRK